MTRLLFIHVCVRARACVCVYGVLWQCETARSAKETAQQAVLELDAAYRQRIVYLELWKKGASMFGSYLID